MRHLDPEAKHVDDDNGKWHMMGGGAAWEMMLVFLNVIAGAAALVLLIRDSRADLGPLGSGARGRRNVRRSRNVQITTAEH